MRFTAACVCLLQVVAVSVSAFSTQSITSRKGTSLLKMVSGADIEQDVSESTPQVVGNSVIYRGKVNEVDFCIAPADVSLSRAYNQNSKDKKNPLPKTLSLTRALNNASNRAVRRILLARCWPSAEALNLSLRLVAQAEKKALEEREASGQALTSSAKCPVPRPILNILTRKGEDRKGEEGGAPMPRSRTNEEYVKDQILSFQDKYGALPGFSDAEAYLEAVLSLATSGEESPRVNEVMDAGFYDESYRRVIAVLKSVGAVMETVPGTERKRIANKLADQDICLSMIDKVNLKRVVQSVPVAQVTNRSAEPEVKVEVEKEVDSQDEGDKKKRRIMFWMKEKESTPKSEVKPEEAKDDDTFNLSKDDLGAVVLSAEEPTMTRQLNSLSNIVQRALLFGGDQELLVLSETLSANKPAFIDRWYPGTGVPVETLENETRAGIQYLNALILLLREAYSNGIVTTLDPFVTLLQTYANAYERLTATLVELGSGYVRPMTDPMTTMPKPRTAQEELGRFAVWEANFRSKSSGGSTGEASSYPEDLEGPWEVKDEVGGETIGVSTVFLEPEGTVKVAPPLQGLRWRLDPGPTHLDTCTFQVLAEDETVLQYRGFIDRGARLEARFSKRPTTIRGSVMFQMRDGDLAVMGEDYWKDMLPINYKTGTTKFVMTKILDKSQ